MPMAVNEAANFMDGVSLGFPMSAAKAAPMEMQADKQEAAIGGGAPMVEPTVRTKFADTALWVGALTTDKDGTAEVSLDMPENLTTWRIKVWGMGHGTKVGQGFADVVTRKDLIIRLEAPRFFVQTDEVVLSAVVHNYLKTKKDVRVQLEVDARTLKLLDKGSGTPPYDGPAGGGNIESNTKGVTIEPNSEARVDWHVRVLDEGEALVRMKALTDEESDAMEQKFPCYIHGMLKTDSFSGAIRPKDESGRFTVTVPKDRRPKESRLEVRYSPTLAGAMVDALPYLVDYPYGCTEQTLNRFLPSVITQKVLLDMKLDLADIQKKRTNLNVQEIGDDAHRATQWKRLDRNPVFDQDEVRRMVKDGVERLTEMQCSDGGWGWFSGAGGSRLANRPAKRRGPRARHVGPRRRLAQAVSGRASPVDQERRNQGQTRRPAMEASGRQSRRLRLHGSGRRRREERRHARFPLPRSHASGRLRHGYVRHRAREAARERKAGHDHAEHQPVR
jgi:hypothetical protein